MYVLLIFVNLRAILTNSGGSLALVHLISYVHVQFISVMTIEYYKHNGLYLTSLVFWKAMGQVPHHAMAFKINYNLTKSVLKNEEWRIPSISDTIM